MVKKKNLMKLRKISLSCLFLSVLSSFFGWGLRISFLGIGGAVLLIVYTAISFVFWRCPYCKKRLPIRFNVNVDVDDIYRCPYCNEIF